MSEVCNLSAAIVAGSEESSYVIKVDGYSSIKERIKHGKYVKSIPFTVGGHNWVVRYYPNGCPAENLPYCISVFLVLDSVLAKGVKAKVRFSLLDKDGEAVASHSRTTDENIFPTKDSTWGIRDL
jgi:speckle-type POZ protein